MNLVRPHCGFSSRAMPNPSESSAGIKRKSQLLRGSGAAGGGWGAPLLVASATNPARYGRSGCVFTALGFAWDWNRLISGSDPVHLA